MVVFSPKEQLVWSLGSDFSYRFPNEKVHNLDSTKDGLLVLRHITSQKLKAVHYRENRPHMLAENVKFELEDNSVSLGFCNTSDKLFIKVNETYTTTSFKNGSL